ncbi:hypothetical protein PSN45_001172 [Yamadazyma tenuis]|uniref:uncharacterized protein n=1 Tax=Candida tenuis TaxID=2315449 RepID=UPI0027A14B62|nr:hypothetical protein PSN45_001172 [Yamadazyma tenuis]
MEIIPETITSALEKSRERTFLLKLETDLIKFISSLSTNTNREYIIGPHILINSYFRLLGHQLCNYYSLSHWNLANCSISVGPTEDVDYGVISSDISLGKKKTLKVYLNPSSPPKVADTNSNPDIKQVARILKPRRIMKSEGTESSSSITTSSLGSATPTSLQEDSGKLHDDRETREALYLKIRQEIFQKDNEEDDDSDSGSDGEFEGTESDYSSNTSFDKLHRSVYDQRYPPETPLESPITMSQYSAPQMMSPASYSYFIPMPVYGNYGVQYDKETERKLLNNPYIIIPDTNHNRRKPKRHSSNYHGSNDAQSKQKDK